MNVAPNVKKKISFFHNTNRISDEKKATETWMTISHSCCFPLTFKDLTVDQYKHNSMLTSMLLSSTKHSGYYQCKGKNVHDAISPLGNSGNSHYGFFLVLVCCFLLFRQLGEQRPQSSQDLGFHPSEDQQHQGAGHWQRKCSSRETANIHGQPSKRF